MFLGAERVAEMRQSSVAFWTSGSSNWSWKVDSVDRRAASLDWRGWMSSLSLFVVLRLLLHVVDR